MREYQIYIITKFHRYIPVMAESPADAKTRAFELMAGGLDPCEEADIERYVFVDEEPMRGK